MARGNNYGSRTWSGGTIGGAVFGPAGPLAARTTHGVTAQTCLNGVNRHLPIAGVNSTPMPSM